MFDYLFKPILLFILIGDFLKSEFLLFFLLVKV
jgi:hypothetical protein